MDQEQRSSRIAYPKLPATLTKIDLPRLFDVTSEEWVWARSVDRRGPSVGALLTHPKIFQCLTANSVCVILHNSARIIMHVSGMVQYGIKTAASGVSITERQDAGRVRYGVALTRREMMAMALASLAVPAAARVTTALHAPKSPAGDCYRMVYEPWEAVGQSFARSAKRLGACVEPVSDLTSFWFDELAPLWREKDLPVAGLTSPAMLLCLEQLAWPLGLRVVFRADHHERAPGEYQHRIARPNGWVAVAGLSHDWPRRMAQALMGLDTDVMPSEQISHSMVTAPMLHQHVFITWIIAGKDDAMQRQGRQG
jgi:hypothetical protein